jgi:hypothetical protein
VIDQVECNWTFVRFQFEPELPLQSIEEVRSGTFARFGGGAARNIVGRLRRKEVFLPAMYDFNR